MALCLVSFSVWVCECVEPSCAQCVPNWTKLELRCVMLAPSLPKLATKLPKLAPSCFLYELLHVFAYYFFQEMSNFLLFFQSIWNDFFETSWCFWSWNSMFSVRQEAIFEFFAFVFYKYSFLLTFGCTLIFKFIKNEGFEKQVGLCWAKLAICWGYLWPMFD